MVVLEFLTNSTLDVTKFSASLSFPTPLLSLMVGFFHPFSTEESKDDEASFALMAVRLMAILNIFGRKFHTGTIKKTLSLYLQGSLTLLRAAPFQRSVAIMGCCGCVEWGDLLGNVEQSLRGFWRLGLYSWNWQSVGTSVGRRAPWRCSLSGLCLWAATFRTNRIFF